MLGTRPGKAYYTIGLYYGPPMGELFYLLYDSIPRRAPFTSGRGHLNSGPLTHSPAPFFSQFHYLAVHLLQAPPEDVFQPRPPVVGEVATSHPRLFQEHAHIA